MRLVLMATGTSGHTEAIFELEKIKISFSKTDPQERGMIENLVEKAQKEGMKLHSMDDKENLKEIDNQTLLDMIFKKKGKLVLTGTVDAVKKIALDIVEKEIRERSLVMEAQDDGTWKILREAGEFKDKEEKQAVTTSKAVGGG